MSSTTPNRHYPIPDETDAPDGAAQITALGSAVDTDLASLLTMQAYTPTLGTVSGAAPTGWTTSGFYQQLGKLVFFEATFQAMAGFTTGGGAYAFGLPTATAQGLILPVGWGVVTNTDYNFIAIDTNDTPSGTCCLYQPGSTVRMGIGGPYNNAWAVGNVVRIAGVYRAA